MAGVGYIGYGILWIYWLRALEQEQDNSKKCNEIHSTLRTILNVLAWLGVSITSIFLIVHIVIAAGTIHMPGLMSNCALVLFLLFIIAIYVVQIQYIQQIYQSGRTVADNCTEIEQFKRGMLIVYASLVILAGLFVTFGAGLTNDDVYVSEDAMKKAEMQKIFKEAIESIKKSAPEDATKNVPASKSRHRRRSAK